MCHHIFHAIRRLFHHGRHCAILAALAVGLTATSAHACNVSTAAVFGFNAVGGCGVVQQQAFVQQAFVPSVAVVQAVPSIAVQSFFVPSVAVVSPFVDGRVRQRAFLGTRVVAGGGRTVVRSRTVIRGL
jgi:hypothetical protein